jgi:hypothetical protein
VLNLKTVPRRRVVDGPDPQFPDRWQGGKRDFGFVRIFDGHRPLTRFRTDSWDDDEYERQNPMCVEDPEEDSYPDYTSGGGSGG